MSREGLPDITREEVVARLADAGAPDLDRIASQLHQTIWLRPDPAREPGLLQSRFGGPAMVLPDFEWPHYSAEPYMGSETDGERFTVWYGQKTKAPLFMLAQINLAEVPLATALPPAGLLSFFADPFDGVWGHSLSDRQGFRVTFTPEEQMPLLGPREMPERTGQPGAFSTRKWPQYTMTFFLKWSLPVQKWLTDTRDQEPWSDVPDRFQEAWGEIAGYGFGHFLLDGGLNHQGDPRESAVLMLDPPPPPTEETPYEEYAEYHAEMERRAMDWTTLFSITQDQHLNPVVGDTGGLSFVVRKSDLAERRFDRVARPVVTRPSRFG